MVRVKKGNGGKNQMASKLSKSGSFEGWDFFKWIRGNWVTIKELLKVGAPLLFGMEFFKNNPVMIGSVTLIGKGLLDIIQYWLKEKHE